MLDMVPRLGRPTLDLHETEAILRAMQWLYSSRYHQNKAEMARDFGTSAAAISQILSGKNRPSYQTAKVTAQKCGVSIAALVGGTWRPGDPPVSVITLGYGWEDTVRRAAQLDGIPEEVALAVLSSMAKRRA